MGEDLKGKECGKGICQRKDGLYSARYTVYGKTRYSHFKTVKEAKAWLKEEKDTRNKHMTCHARETCFTTADESFVGR